MGFLIPILRTSVLQNMSSQENVQKLFFGVLRNIISLLPPLPPLLNVTKVTHLAYSPSPTPALRNISMAPKGMRYSLSAAISSYVLSEIFCFFFVLSSVFVLMVAMLFSSLITAPLYIIVVTSHRRLGKRGSI